MPHISTSAHKKFISQCNSVIESFSENPEMIDEDQHAMQIKEDLIQLHNIANGYVQTISKLPAFAREYHTLQRQIRSKINKFRFGIKKAKKESHRRTRQAS